MTEDQLEEESNEPMFCECGHSFGQHSKGPVKALYCRHCPCQKWQPEAFTVLRNIVSFAYKQGYHEVGYDIVGEIQNAQAALHLANIRLAQESHQLQNDPIGYWRDRCNRSEQSWADAEARADTLYDELQRLKPVPAEELGIRSEIPERE